MQIKPILSALARHRIAAGLITLEVALACAVLCNAFFLIGNRLELVHLRSGIDEAALGLVSLSGCDDCNNADLNARALDAVRRTPGVRAAGVVNSVPFATPTNNNGLCLDQDCTQIGGVPHFYMVSPGAVAALALQPDSGRTFGDADYQPLKNGLPTAAGVWITRALAAHLWPGQDPLGKEFWAGGHFRVIGTLDHLARPDPGRSEDGVIGSDWSVVIPVREAERSGTYVLRADPRELPRVLAQARAAVARAVPEAVMDNAYSKPLLDLRQEYFQSDRAMTGLLVAIIVAMLLVTALGIVGLASFWVQQRTKQIGIRRALGATRRDILRYFQTENLLLVGAGVALGMLLAYGGNVLLMQVFELERLPSSYLPVGALLLCALGQLAVLGPALRAAAVAPAIATRSA
ncbi:FtsX-like permease family protein [Xanthomonas sp. 3498]|uniref:ABC transporter permease n=1 Tax=Xanthomonas sp. 3498 TaxID=2663863 RepID=UPI00161C1F97|nr:FtsX-like permease family protein [Xanthomonas sp. 3498]MBB5878725.1 putative ABC transport system permease protein [Xanthomonas sp. 3498]